MTDDASGTTDAAATGDDATAPPFWVGIGASAGGLEALRAFARQLSAKLPATYLVAQHMAPQQKSMLVDIIGRETDLPVRDVTDGLAPRAGTIYITPPNSNVLVADGRLKLVPPSERPGAPKPSVDVLFESLADELGAAAIGIVLSGTGSDGAKGIRRIRAAGGITVAQDEHTAKYTGMPIASQDTDCVDLVLSPEELGTQFHLLLDTPRNLDALRREPLTGQAMERLNELLYLRTKIDFRHYKAATVQRRVERRMAATGAEDLDDYVRIAGDSAEEVDELFKDLLITVTSFFRDPEEFAALARHVGRLVKSRAGKSLRVWVAGVATGEEAYTIAIQFAEALGGLKAFAEADIQIFATDIDAEAIAIARRGVYPEAALAAMSEERTAAWFEPHGSGYAVRKLLREKVVFSIHDVARDPPFLKLDLISCRNLLIYFRTELQARVFDRFHYALKDEALLLLGKAETVGASLTLFRPAAPDKHIFFQKSSHRRSLADPRPPTLPAAPARTPRSRSKPSPESDGAVSRLASLIHALGPDALLVGADARILEVYGELGAYAGLSARTGLDTTAFSLLAEPWSQDVRIGTSIALRGMTVHEGISRPTPNRPGHVTNVVVYPMDDTASDERIALVAFRSREDASPAVGDMPPADVDDPEDVGEWKRLVAALGGELELARANLQITSEELETANEELQSTNEEMQSTNEELQSTNEELETSSEELQSTNEELSTVNDELQVNSRLLSSINQRQRSILDNVVTPMVVVDRRLRVIDASLSAAAAFGVPDDLTEPHLSSCAAPEGFPPLERLVAEALETRTRRDVQGRTDASSATLSIAPYRAPDGELLGAIVQLADSTDALRRVVAELELIFAHVPVAIALCDTGGDVIAANANAHHWLGLDSPALIGRNAHEHLPEELAEKLRGLDRGALESGETASGETYFLEVEKLEPKWVRTTHVPFADGESGESMVLLMSEDLTRQHEEERRTEHFRTRMQLALEASDIGMWEGRLGRGESFWSERFREIVGLDADFPASTDAFVDRVHPGDRETLAGTMETAERTGEPYALRVRIVREGGELRWANVRGRRVESEDEDEDGKLIGTLIDETELVTRLEQTTSLNNHLRLAEQLSETGYWQLDLDEDQALFWSDQVYTIHGLDPGSYSPTVEDALAFYHPEDQERVSALVERAIATTSDFAFTARVRQASGEYRQVKSLGVAQRDETTGAGRLFGVFMDVTELTERERSLGDAHDELARSNEELSRFSYVCSHDMKEPVRLIETMATLLLDDDAHEHPDRNRELLTRVKSNTERLRAIIDGLLAYSRVEARVDTGPVDLARVAQEIRDALSLLFAEKNAELVVGELPVVEGARVHFVQLIQNLVGNALAYTDSERPLVRIGSRSADDAVELVIEDNGPGIPEAERARVFDVFSRLELNTRVEGTGLGLSICQRIVQQYGGTIACAESELGGAAFVIRLPASSTAPEPDS